MPCMKTKKKVNSIKNEMKTLAEIMGTVPTSPYQTNIINDYIVQMSKMNLIELQKHAVGVGIRPSGDRILLEKTLINVFKSTNNTLAGLAKTSAPKVKKPEGLLEIIKRK